MGEPARQLDSLVAQASDVAGQVGAKRRRVETEDVAAVNAKASRSLYAKRQPIYPKAVKGRYRRLKWSVMLVTLAIYYLTPWIRWDRGGGPDQAVLLDLPNRRFYFFFIEIWPQEVYYLTGLLILAAVALFLVTAVAGRVWCGYACPQTVWTDLFLLIERWIEGDRGQQMRLARQPWTWRKIGRKAVKHGLWLLVALATGGAWVFYFADAPTLAADLLAFEAPTVAYAFIGILTFTTYWLGGHMREQVCTYMCPWPRIQGAMLDEDSLVVTYRDFRGEPRGPMKKLQPSGEPFGDCIDCKQCVAVCPMGIDIRDGQQMECITCALCIDACHEVMARIDRPRGLIAYDTIGNLERRQQGKATRLRLLRPRIVLYFAVMVLVAGIMAFAFATRSTLDLSLLPDRNPLYVTLSDGSIRNGYTLKILNKAPEARHFAVTLEGLPGAEVTLGGEGDTEGVTAPADRLVALRLFVAAPPASLAGAHNEIVFVLTDAEGQVIRSTTVFRGP